VCARPAGALGACTGSALCRARVRRAQVVEVKEREVTISRLELSRPPGGRDVAFHVGCSKGTYIRSLVNDLVRRAPRALPRPRRPPAAPVVAARAGKKRECFL